MAHWIGIHQLLEDSNHVEKNFVDWNLGVLVYFDLMVFTFRTSQRRSQFQACAPRPVGRGRNEQPCRHHDNCALELSCCSL